MHRRLYLMQCVRGIAAILVVLYHATILFNLYYKEKFMYGFFSNGNIGVDIFFVLSGFIIYFIHGQDIGKKQRFKIYVLKRFLRIYPVYWAITLALIPVYIILPSFGAGYETDLIVILSSLALFPLDHNPVLGVAWTLCYEMMFYVAFGLMIYSRRAILPIIAVWVALIFAFLVLQLTFSHYLLNFIFNQVILEFVIGVFIAYLVQKRTINIGKYILSLGILTLLFVLVGYNGENHFVLYCLTAVLLICGSSAIDYYGSDEKSPKLLQYLGDASYSIYLTHLPCMSMANKAMLYLSAGDFIGKEFSMILCVLFAIIFGCLFHSLVEAKLLAVSKAILSRRRPHPDAYKGQTENIS